MSQNNIAKLLLKVLRMYDINVSYHSMELIILTHPEYPSMQCISDALDAWKIKHVVLKLTLEKLRALDIPVIAHLKKREYIWVIRMTDSKVYFWSESGKGKTESLERFEQEWSGVALAIEDVTDAGEPDYNKKRNREIKEKFFNSFIVGSFVTLLSVLTYFSWTNDSTLSLLPKLFLLIINLIGCYIGYVLIRQEKHQSAALLIFYPQPAGISVPDAVMMGLLFITCLVVVVEKSKTIGSKGHSYTQQREMAKIKYDIRTIQAQLSETEHATDNLGIILGNVIAAPAVLFVSSAVTSKTLPTKRLFRGGCLPPPSP